MVKYTICIIIILFLFIGNIGSSFSKALTGSVTEENYIGTKNKVVDYLTGSPISNARVSIPSEGVNIRTDSKGAFNIDTSIDSPTIMSIKAQGYKPFSFTITKEKILKPMIIGMVQKAHNEIIIDQNLRHLGDNSYSIRSANANDFSLESSGYKFFKKFFVGKAPKNRIFVLKIGSIIGLDTRLAQKLRQNHINSVSTPTEIFINSRKVGEIKVNGDNKEIIISSNYIRQNAYNYITIETGQNEELKGQIETDYDDIEFMNLILEIR